MNKKSFAILMCTYNGDDFNEFKESIESLLQAEIPLDYTMHLYLHIDGPIDDLRMDYINSIDFYKVVSSKLNVGLSKGLNKCIGVLEDEEYYFRMDSDDLCEKQRFVKQIEFMDHNDCVDFSGGAIGEFLGSRHNITYERHYPEANLDIIDFLIKGSPFAHVTMCFRKGFFDKFGGYPVGFPLNEDIALWMQVLKLGAIGSNIKDRLVLVRMDSAYARRTIKKAYYEYRVYLLISFWQRKLPIHPTLRFLFRLCPEKLVKIIYNSKFRNKLLK